MGLVVSNKGGGDFERTPAGMHVARCWRVVDLGTQSSTWQGKPKQQHKIMLSFEIVSPGTAMQDGRPFTISQRYTASLSENAQLRKDLESWRGRKFSAAELEGFDLKNLLGKPCLINVVHEEKADKTYENIQSITPLMPGMTAPPAKNESYLFSLAEFDGAVYDQLTDGLKKVIADSPEYKAMQSGSPAPANKPAQNMADLDDDIPF